MSPAWCAHRGFCLDLFNLLAVRCEVGVRFYTQLPKSSRALRACTVPRKGRPRRCSAFAKQKTGPAKRHECSNVWRESVVFSCRSVLPWFSFHVRVLSVR